MLPDPELDAPELFVLPELDPVVVPPAPEDADGEPLPVSLFFFIMLVCFTFFLVAAATWTRLVFEGEAAVLSDVEVGVAAKAKLELAMNKAAADSAIFFMATFSWRG